MTCKLLIIVIGGAGYAIYRMLQQIATQLESIANRLYDFDDISKGLGGIKSRPNGGHWDSLKVRRSS